MARGPQLIIPPSLMDLLREASLELAEANYRLEAAARWPDTPIAIGLDETRAAVVDAIHQVNYTIRALEIQTSKAR